jgi:hypothetical protein
VVALRHRLKKRNCLHGEIHVILLHVHRAEGENAKRLCLGNSRQTENNEAAYKTHVPNHREALPS